ncbi:unnamed protein product [Lymnaea stagnalis]|uniref:Surfeit locus protein 2 n=1 Tax=Lymnaea stagnalis TaxID=6523 RepID=A0AAV2HP22_LYMST
MASTDVNKLLESHSSLIYIPDKNKIRCALTKHEMPATIEAVRTYVDGKKYKKARSEQTYNYDQHKPHIVPSSKKKHTHELFCTLTLRHIGKAPQDVERHINGKRFKRALARWTKCKETGEKFTPRSGGRQKKTVNSDSDSVSGGDNIWSDDADDDSNNNDDMSDLYPVDDFNDSGDEAETAANDNDTDEPEKENNVDTPSPNGPADSESDYDLNVLDKDEAVSEDKTKSPNTKDSVEKKANKKLKRKLDKAMVKPVGAKIKKKKSK